jgi:hypothetical protein
VDDKTYRAETANMLVDFISTFAFRAGVKNQQALNQVKD